MTAMPNTEPDYDDPEVEDRWCMEMRERVAAYLQDQQVAHGRVGKWPAWHVAPYVSVWAIESTIRPEWIGWWVVCGDLPTDYISASDVAPPQHPRKAVRAIGERWQRVVEAWNRGEEPDDFKIRGSSSRKELAPLLSARAEILSGFADDDSMWEE